MSENMHLIIMGAGFISLLLVSYVIGTSALVLFFFLCFFMMTIMMLWGHGNGKGGGHDH